MKKILKFINDYDEFLSHVFIFFAFIIASFLVFKCLDNNQTIREKIIEKSDDYTIYKDCTSIQGNYYCKDLIDDKK